MESKQEAWIEGNAFRIREMFDLFDKDKSETVVNEEVFQYYQVLPMINDFLRLELL